MTFPRIVLNLLMKDVEHIASVIYTLYCKEVGGVAFNGDKLPTWEEFSSDDNKTKQANAWRRVAEIVSLD